MKLRNLLFASMIACAFVSCHEEDPVIDNGGDAALDGTTLIVATEGLASKADGDAGNIEVLVFNNGVLELPTATAASHIAVEGSAIVSKCFQYTSGTKDVIVISNKPAGITFAAGAAKADVLATIYSPTAMETAAALTMSSREFTGIVLAQNKHNCLGFAAKPTGDNVNWIQAITEPVKLYRNVAKIKLGTIQAVDTKYKGANLKVKNVYLVKGNRDTKIVAANYWDASLATPVTGNFSGFSQADYLAYAEGSVGKAGATYTAEQLGVSVTEGIATLVEGYAYTTEPAYAVNKNDVAVGTATAVSFGDSFYAYENAQGDMGATLLVVEAELWVKEKIEETGEIKDKNLGIFFYPVKVGEGVNANFSEVKELAAYNTTSRYTALEGELSGVYRNLEYTINLKIKGEGQKNPFIKEDEATFMDVQTIVVAYGKVTQNEEF